MKNFLRLPALMFLTSLAYGANATVMVSGNSLQSNLDNITFADASNPAGNFRDVNDPSSRQEPDELWATSSSGASVMRLLFEIAGFASTNSFGIYDPFDTSKKLELFSGADSGTSSFGNPAFELLWNPTSGSFSDVNYLLSGGSAGSSATFTSNIFGYYLDSSSRAGGGVFYSEKAKNSDGVSHMIAFDGDNSERIDLGAGPKYFAPGEYILAWEDLDCDTGCDADYSDMVVLVESVGSVPVAGTLMLFGIGLMGFRMSLRKRG